MNPFRPISGANFVNYISYLLAIIRACTNELWRCCIRHPLLSHAADTVCDPVRKSPTHPTFENITGCCVSSLWALHLSSKIQGNRSSACQNTAWNTNKNSTCKSNLCCSYSTSISLIYITCLLLWVSKCIEYIAWVATCSYSLVTHLASERDTCTDTTCC